MGLGNNGWQNSLGKYRFYLDWKSSEPFDPEKDAVDVRLVAEGGSEYWTTFTTKNFLDYMFEKNRRTGECAGSSYFSMEGMVIVERLDDDVVGLTIADLIENHKIESYFRPLEKPKEI